MPLFTFYDIRVLSFLFQRGIRLWNQLPLPIKDSRSVAAFERAVFGHLRTNLTGLLYIDVIELELIYLFILHHQSLVQFRLV
jgi:hypothetical protein